MISWPVWAMGLHLLTGFTSANICNGAHEAMKIGESNMASFIFPIGYPPNLHMSIENSIIPIAERPALHAMVRNIHPGYHGSARTINTAAIGCVCARINVIAKSSATPRFGTSLFSSDGRR